MIGCQVSMTNRAKASNVVREPKRSVARGDTVRVKFPATGVYPSLVQAFCAVYMALGCPTCGELQLLSDLPSAGSGCRPSRWIIATSGLVLFLVELGYVVSEKGPPPWSMLTATLKPHTAPRAMIPPASARRRPHRASQMQTPKPKAMAMHPSLPVLIEAKPSAPTAGALPPTLAWAMWLGLLLSGAAAWWWYWWRWGRSQETWVTLMTMGSEEGELSGVCSLPRHTLFLHECTSCTAKHVKNTCDNDNHPVYQHGFTVLFFFSASVCCADTCI